MTTHRHGARTGPSPGSRQSCGPGEQLVDLRGEWEGDRIAMRARWATTLPDKASVQRAAEESALAFELRRADKAAYERAC